MFDDLTKENNNKNDSPYFGVKSSNSQFSEIGKNNFNSEKNDKFQFQKDEKVEDIFSDEEKNGEKPHVFNHKLNSSVEGAVNSADNYGPISSSYKKGGSNNIKKILILISILAVIFLIFIVIFQVSKKFLGQDNVEQINKENETAQDEKINESEILDQGNILKEEANKTAILEDSDKDGLLDSEEIIFGTSIDKVDTDGDGLFDREEVKVYKTDPLNSDTDGDGYLDGDEVKGGRNPKGQGMLYNLPGASSNDINDYSPIDSDIDSDNDGLFDYQELNLYMTDPLNPDTDGDGYLDGEEVKNGYNPNESSNIN